MKSNLSKNVVLLNKYAFKKAFNSLRLSKGPLAPSAAAVCVHKSTQMRKGMNTNTLLQLLVCCSIIAAHAQDCSDRDASVLSSSKLTTSVDEDGESRPVRRHCRDLSVLDDTLLSPQSAFMLFSSRT